MLLNEKLLKLYTEMQAKQEDSFPFDEALPFNL